MQISKCKTFIKNEHYNKYSSVKTIFINNDKLVFSQLKYFHTFFDMCDKLKKKKVYFVYVWKKEICDDKYSLKEFSFVFVSW